MAQWTNPHDENHRFLQWGPRDEVFSLWCNYFIAKGIKFEVGGGEDNWTIYKHMRYCRVMETPISRCCPEVSDL